MGTDIRLWIIHDFGDKVVGMPCILFLKDILER